MSYRLHHNHVYDFSKEEIAEICKWFLSEKGLIHIDNGTKLHIIDKNDLLFTIKIVKRRKEKVCNIVETNQKSFNGHFLP
jgi:riboflavin synthase alpha subunit